MTDSEFYHTALRAGLEVSVVDALNDLRHLTGEEVEYYKTPMWECPYSNEFSVVVGTSAPQSFSYRGLLEHNEILRMMQEAKAVAKAEVAPDCFGLGEAIDNMREGQVITKGSWGSGHLALQTPDEHSKMQQPYIYKGSESGMVPWTPTQEELLAVDYQVVKD